MNLSQTLLWFIIFIFVRNEIRWRDEPECCPDNPRDPGKLGVKSSNRFFSFSEMPKHKSSNVSINALTNNYTASASRHISHNNWLADSDHSTEGRVRRRVSHSGSGHWCGDTRLARERLSVCSGHTLQEITKAICLMILSANVFMNQRPWLAKSLFLH